MGHCTCIRLCLQLEDEVRISLTSWRSALRFNLLVASLVLKFIQLQCPGMPKHFLLLSLQVLWLAMTIHLLKDNSLLRQFRCHWRVVYSYPCHKDLYDALTCTWKILGFGIVSPSVSRGHSRNTISFLGRTVLLPLLCLWPRMRLPNAFPHKWYRLGLPFPYCTNASLFSGVHLHCLRVYHLLCVSSTTAEGCLSRPAYPSSPNFRWLAQCWASLAVFC